MAPKVQTHLALLHPTPHVVMSLHTYIGNLPPRHDATRHLEWARNNCHVGGPNGNDPFGEQAALLYVNRAVEVATVGELSVDGS